MPFYDLVCESGHEQIDVLLKLGERPPCPTCGESVSTLWRSSPSVVADDIPGGIEIKHGICHDDGTPKRYYSKSEMTKAAKDKGLLNMVRHVGSRGGDKALHTTRWI